MGLLFYDSFNHYGTSITPKWDFANFSTIQVSGQARTGTRALQILGGASGPAKNLGPQQQRITYNKLIQGVAVNLTGVRRDASDLMYFSVVGQSVNAQNIKVQLNMDGSMQVTRGLGDGPSAVVATSVGTPFVFNDWNYIEAKWFGDTVNGSIEVRLANSTHQMAVIMSFTGNTVAFAAAPVCNQVQLLADVGISFNCLMNDYYCLDWTDGSDYLGGVKIFYDVPFDNGATVQWTPSAGTNWQNVNEVPPDDGATLNSAAAVGLIDQYQHNVTAVPVNSQIKSVQHVMDCSLDAGTRAITSVCNGVAHPNSVYLPNGYSMFTYAYDTNPASGLPWKFPDFPSLFGPMVTV